ncbi:MAG: DUF268 domain-containing protein [Methanobacteriaceae archaeon]|nr:DUF268 domain-containing protein [Candidatus Methanorudis spinitermitis]
MNRDQMIKYYIAYSKIRSTFNKDFKKDMKNYKKFQLSNDNFKVDNQFLYPCLDDKSESAGILGSYFWQDLWAAQHIFKDNPKKHYDIGSRVDGFIGHLASFRENIILIDIRPLSKKIPGVHFIQADATNLENIPDDSIESLTSLCALEHFGLGRYGEPIDPDAYFKSFKAIQNKIKKNGKVYISVPVGKEHLEFNAHRVFYPETIINSFDEMKLLEFSYINHDIDQIEYNVKINKYDKDMSFGGKNFGLFLFQKL